MALELLAQKINRTFSTSATFEIKPSKSGQRDEADVIINTAFGSTSFMVPLPWLASTDIGVPMIRALVEDSTASIRSGSTGTG